MEAASMDPVSTRMKFYAIIETGQYKGHLNVILGIYN